MLNSIMAKVDHENEPNTDLDRINDQDDEESVSSTTPSVTGLALHSSFNCGIIRPIFGGSFGGAIGSALSSLPLADRFYVGGPGQLRGFLPSGIGPRSIDAGGSSVPGGDSLGGDLFYTSTLAISAPFPTYFAALRGNGARLFGFANAGTCVVSTASPLIGMDSPETWRRILSSTRLAVGGGVSAGLPLGRFEATYAVPVRYGRADVLRYVQFGLSAQFGG
jgi:outer membrane protein assembly factor BamA